MHYLSTDECQSKVCTIDLKDGDQTVEDKEFLRNHHTEVAAMVREMAEAKWMKNAKAKHIIDLKDNNQAVGDKEFSQNHPEEQQRHGK